MLSVLLSCVAPENIEVSAEVVKGERKQAPMVLSQGLSQVKSRVACVLGGLE